MEEAHIPNDWCDCNFDKKCKTCKKRDKSELARASHLFVLVFLARHYWNSLLNRQDEPAITKAIKWAGILTAACCILVIYRQYRVHAGEDIICSTGVQTNAQEMKAITSYCYMSSTFTLSYDLPLNAYTPHPGLGPTEGKEDITVHTYYQWVPFVLTVQAFVLCCVPSIMWGDANYVNMLLNETQDVHVDEDENKRKRCESVRRFRISMGNGNKNFFWNYLRSEFAGVILAIGNLFITNLFLGGKFFTYGPKALRFLFSSDVMNPNNPLNQVFPKIGKCTFHKFGPTGTIINKDAICVLPQNIANEKVFVFLWLVYFAVTAFVCLMFLYHLILFLMPELLSNKIKSNVEGRTAQAETGKILKLCSKADKFTLWQLQPKVAEFSRWVTEFEKNLDAKQSKTKLLSVDKS